MIDVNSTVNTLELNKKDFKNVSTENLEEEKLKSVCNDFEAYFLKQIMDESFKTSSIAGEGVGSDIIKSMYTDGMSRHAAGGMGISDMLFEFLSKKNNL